MISAGFMIWSIITIVVIMAMIAAYNSFVVKRNNVDNALSAVDTQLKLRFDLIPNLVATVQTYAKHESETLSKITAYRSHAMDPGTSIVERMECGTAVSGLMHNIMLQLERYPVLQANTNFIHLQRTLNEIEAQLSAARRTYNAAATEYNTSIQLFPNCIFASLFHFARRPLFEAADEDRKNPDVKKLFS